MGMQENILREFEMANKLRWPLFCVSLLMCVSYSSARAESFIECSRLDCRASHAFVEDTRRGTITTVRSPTTKNVKVYRKVSRRSVRGAGGVTTITSTATTTITTLTQRVTVIKKVTSGSAAKSRKGKSGKRR